MKFSKDIAVALYKRWQAASRVVGNAQALNLCHPNCCNAGGTQESLDDYNEIYDETYDVLKDWRPSVETIDADNIVGVLEKMRRHFMCERYESPLAFGHEPNFIGCEIHRDTDPNTYCLGCEAEELLLAMKDSK